MKGKGLKIALTTLNAGRLSLPALCASASKWSLNVAREWSGAREQWGRPVGGHEAIAEKIGFIAATSFALDAVVELSSLLADDDQNDIRIEAALAKLYGSEMAWKVADDLLQIRGGRGYETAASLAARGEKAIPVEQVLRDLRINRIFEGSTEIMHLLIAREAVDTHLAVGGDIIDKTLPTKQRAQGRGSRRWFLRGLAAEVGGRCRPVALVVHRVRTARQATALRRAGIAPAGPIHVLRHVPLAGPAGVPAGVPRPHRRHRR